MHVQIHIDCDNEAFEEEPASEVERILRRMANTISKYGLLGVPSKIMDINGNQTGTFEFKDDE